MPGERQACQLPSDVVWAAPGLSSDQEGRGQDQQDLPPKSCWLLLGFSLESLFPGTSVCLVHK